MICAQCLYRTASRLSTHTLRALTTSSITRAAVQPISHGTLNTSNPSRNPMAANPTSAAQPLSTPLQPSPAPQPSKTKEPPRILSSVPAGTALKGLNYFKNKPDPVALEDHEYPDWLWTLLDEKKRGPADGQKEEMDPRLFSKSSNARRMANKRARKMAQINAESAAPKVPLHEQSIDLPGGEEAGQARGELTKSMRGKRRRDIKEANFLKSMT